MIRVLVWNEFRHERQQPAVAEIYPRGMHAAIGDYLAQSPDISVRLACLDDPEQGLSEEVLSETDVLIWWGHMAHGEVTDENVQRVCHRVDSGMGFIGLHSAHHSKVFRALCGTSCNLKWRHGDRERVWTVIPSHPIARGIPEHFELPREEMYGEPFDIPAPDEVVFMAGSPGERCSAAESPTAAAPGGYSIFSPVMRNIRRSSMRMCCVLLETPCAGRLRRMALP